MLREHLCLSMHIESLRTYVRCWISVLPQTWWSPTVGWMKARLNSTNVLFQRFYQPLEVYPVYWWSILIFLWWKLPEYVFACWAATCFLSICIHLLGDLFLCAWRLCCFWYYIFPPFPNYSNVHVDSTKQSDLSVYWVYFLLVIWWLFTSSWGCLLVILGWLSHVSLFWWLWVWSSSFLFCSYYSCGHLIHAPLWFHASMVPLLLTVLLQFIL